MDIDPFWLVAAAAGGFFGAAIGALQAFIFCGLTVLLGVVGIFGNASAVFISYVPFGPVFGPHIAFAGGVAAVAYARKRGLADGRDIVTPLITLRQPTVLLVGADLRHAGVRHSCCHCGNSVVRRAYRQRRAHRRGLGADRPLRLRLVRAGGRGYPNGRPDPAWSAHCRRANPPTRHRSPNNAEPVGWARFAPTETNNWVRYQEGFYHNSMLGLFAGGMSAGIALMIVQNIPSSGRRRGNRRVRIVGLLAAVPGTWVCPFPSPIT